MLKAEGIFDGESVKFSAPVDFKKNQRVVVTLAEDAEEKNIRTEEDRNKVNDFFENYGKDGKRTNYNADAFVRYERGCPTAEDIRILIREGTLKPEDLREFEKEYFFMEKLLKTSLALRKNFVANDFERAEELIANAEL